MARLSFKSRHPDLSRRGRVNHLRNCLPRHHMGRINRAPMNKPMEATQATN